MAKFSFFDFLNGYETPLADDGSESVTGKRFFFRAVTGSVRKSRSGSLIYKSKQLSDRISRLLSYTVTKSYGVMILVFGFVSFIEFILGEYLPYAAVNRDTMIVGIWSALLSVPFLLSDKPFSIAIQDNRLFSYVLFDFFSIKRAHRTDSEYPSIPIPVSAIIGALLAILGYFISATTVILAVVGLILVYVTFMSPEFAFFLSLLLLPYLTYVPSSELLFPILIALTLLSFIRKVLLGKRVMFLEQYELFIGLMLLSILVSGIFLSGMESFTGSLNMIAMALGYMLAGNLITNRRLCDSTLNAIVFSSIPASVYSYYLLISAAVSGGVDKFIGVGIRSTFMSTDAYALFLVAAIIFSVALAKQSSGGTRVVYFLISLLNLGSLTLTGELFGIAALLIGALAYCLLKARSWSFPLMLIAFFIPYLTVIVPDNVIDPVLSIIPGIDKIEELKTLWRSVWEAISDNFLFGIGIGAESFASVMKDYGVVSFADSKNVFLELCLEAGVFAVAFFVITLFVRIRHRAAYHSYIKSSQLKVASTFAAVVTFCMIALGATEYIWQDGPSFYLFFVIFGLGSATLRAAKREVDDRVLYYEDARAQDYSAIDIEIR